jgi:hypothetical protein
MIHLIILKYIAYVVSRFNSPKSIVNVYSKENKISCNRYYRSKYKNPIIVITDKIKIGGGTTLGYNRKSPEAHIRRGHWRRYKNGLVVWIGDTLVNCNDIKRKPKVYKIINRRSKS